MLGINANGYDLKQSLNLKRRIYRYRALKFYKIPTDRNVMSS
ncbi:hypothetical protein LEP1GSC125_2262 [Leptospira mayottensis 200901122]|uniref:Uncharacterized protein n=1 Tax=Leptospira mayottensis 200901122 TaxID=1193010 RepID=A0AA87MQD1_9LEPT|nr:hypothetical protein LEP1GSC125_2262 [Leptospira mayottensis 200901122]